jgi:hypothetical protein
MRYTIQLERQPSGRFLYKVVGQFDDNHLSPFWGDLGLTAQRRREIPDATGPAAASFVLLPTFPQISMLFYIDEGRICFREAEIGELREESERAMKLARSGETKMLLTMLLRACTLAIEENATIAIHQFPVSIAPGWIEIDTSKRDAPEPGISGA